MERILCTICQEEKCQRKNIYIESVYIVEDEIFDELIESKGITRCEKHSSLFVGVPRKIEGIQSLNRHQLKRCLSVMGVKTSYIPNIAKESFRFIVELLKSVSRVQDTEAFSSVRAITMKKSQLFEVISQSLERAEYTGSDHLIDFDISLNIESRRSSVIVLLGGTSGTGKSTLASLLGSRLGISTILSTDSIRHIIRNFIKKEDNPVLFASTYESGALVKTENMTEKEATIKGWDMQCEAVYEYLYPLVEQFSYTRESVVIEGVHLSVPVIKRLLQQFPSCIPFIIFINSKKKHLERFAVRSKYMTLDPKFNKYIAYHSNIRSIQQKMLDRADQTLIPKVENSNIDRSLGLLHTTLVRVLRRTFKGETVYEASRRQTVLLHEEFNLLKNNIWSSKEAQEVINSRINKGEVFKRFFNYDNFNTEDIEEAKITPSHNTDDQSNPDVGSLVSGSLDADVMRRKHDENKGRQSSRGSISEEDSIHARSSHSYSSEGEHSIHED